MFLSIQVSVRGGLKSNKHSYISVNGIRCVYFLVICIFIFIKKIKNGIHGDEYYLTYIH